MIERMYILCLIIIIIIIIIKSKVWTITHCLGLGHETMVCAVCLSIFLAFRDYKKQTAKEMTNAKVRYVNERVLGELEDGNSKPFYRYIKSLRMDNIGLPPLKSTNTLITSALDKATILLNEFNSVFTHEDTILWSPGSVLLSTRLVKSSPKNLEWGSYWYVWSPTKPPALTRSPTEYPKS